MQRGARMLPAFDPDLVGWLMGGLQRAWHRRQDRTERDSGRNDTEDFLVHFSAEGRTQSVSADLVVHAAGRAPDLEQLDLPAAGVVLKGGRLRLNEFLQSVSNKLVYAAGDAAAAGPPLTPVSSHDAKVVAGNLLEGNRHRPDYRGAPSVAFTVSAIAAVGLTEAEAAAQGKRGRVRSEMVPQCFTARLAEPVYGFKTLVEEGTGRILGAHLVGPGAKEVINLFGLATRHDLTAEALKSTMFAYPTAASDIGSML